MMLAKWFLRRSHLNVNVRQTDAGQIAMKIAYLSLRSFLKILEINAVNISKVLYSTEREKVLSVEHGPM